MKRWAEWERDRRWKAGTQSRDSAFDVLVRTESFKQSDSNRMSAMSSSEHSLVPNDAARTSPAGGGSQFISSESGHSSANRRNDSLPLLELPAPLSQRSAITTPGSTSVPTNRSQSPKQQGLSAHNSGSGESFFGSGGQQQDLPPLPTYPYVHAQQHQHMVGMAVSPAATSEPGMHSPDLSRYPSTEEEYDDSAERDPMFIGNYSPESTFRGRNPFNRAIAQGDYEMVAEPDEMPPSPPQPARSREHSYGRSSVGSRYRGVSLVDDGPVADPTGGQFRTVQRSRRVSQAEQQQQSRRSRTYERNQSVDSRRGLSVDTRSITTQSARDGSPAPSSFYSNTPSTPGVLPPGARKD
jgi:chitin synthase